MISNARLPIGTGTPPVRSSRWPRSISHCPDAKTRPGFSADSGAAWIGISHPQLQPDLAAEKDQIDQARVIVVARCIIAGRARILRRRSNDLATRRSPSIVQPKDRPVNCPPCAINLSIGSALRSHVVRL